MTEPTAKRDRSVAISKSIETGERHPWSYLDSRRYVQHNVNLADGLGAILGFVDSLPAGTSKVRAVRAFEDDDISFTHLEYYLEPYGHTAGFEVHRWEDDRVVEHWDNLQPITVGPNSSGHTMFDGPTEILDLDRTDLNKTVAADYVRDVLETLDDARIGDYVADDVISHLPEYGDGADELHRRLRDARAGGVRHRALRKVLGEGNFVLVMSEGSRGDEQLAIFDLLRLSQGQIVEQWNVVEVIPPRDQWQNTNGKF